VTKNGNAKFPREETPSSDSEAAIAEKVLPSLFVQGFFQK